MTMVAISSVGSEKPSRKTLYKFFLFRPCDVYQSGGQQKNEGKLKIGFDRVGDPSYKQGLDAKFRVDKGVKQGVRAQSFFPLTAWPDRLMIPVYR
jgi:hypothetical protein